MSLIVSSNEPDPIQVCVDATRAWIESVQAAEQAGRGLIEILPAVLAVLREHGFDGSQLPGGLGTIGGMF